jgi:hypothetical protein
VQMDRQLYRCKAVDVRSGQFDSTWPNASIPRLIEKAGVATHRASRAGGLAGAGWLMSRHELVGA